MTFDMAHKDDFTVEWKIKDGYVGDFRITKGAALYRLPWYRRIMIRLLGRSHWHHVKFPPCK
jgi:hypothetical protein